MHLKRCLSTLLLVALLFAFALPANAKAPELSSKSALVYSLNAGDIIYEKDADLILAPASLTKIVTTMTVLSLCEDPDNTKITVPHANLFDEITAVGGSNIELLPGETLTVTELLYAVMLPSACDACNVLAYHFGNGAPSAFVEKMNEWAKAAGAKNSNFQNAHGLDSPGHVSTARDLLNILLTALENERFNEIIRTSEIIIPENALHAKRYINYQTTIPMLYPYTSDYYEGMIGIKSGYTLEAKCCLSSMAERDGETFLVICLGAEKAPENMARVDTRKLYDWAFQNFETKTLLSSGEVLKTVPLSGATSETCELILTDDFAVCAEENEGEVTIAWDVPETISAPFSSDQTGFVIALQNGKEIARRALSYQTEPIPAPKTEEAPAKNPVAETSAPSVVLIVGIVMLVLLLLLALSVIALSRPVRRAPRTNSRPAHPGAKRVQAPPRRRENAPLQKRPPQNRRQG